MAATALMALLQNNVPIFADRAPSADGAERPARAATASQARVRPNVRLSRIEDTGGALVIEPGPNGHFFVEIEINGATVPFMVDTGASVVALSPDMLDGLGIDPASLRYNIELNTANGKGRGASLTLEEMRLGGIMLNDVRAIVVDKPMPWGLLGMAFLSRLAGYQVENGRLILKY